MNEQVPFSITLIVNLSNTFKPIFNAGLFLLALLSPTSVYTSLLLFSEVENFQVKRTIAKQNSESSVAPQPPSVNKSELLFSPYSLRQIYRNLTATPACLLHATRVFGAEFATSASHLREGKRLQGCSKTPPPIITGRNVFIIIIILLIYSHFVGEHTSRFHLN